MLTTYSHTLNSTARLWLMKSHFVVGEKYVIICDREREIDLLRNFAKVIIGKDIRIIETLADFWMMHEQTDGIYALSHELLEMGGQLHYLERHSLSRITRGQVIPMETVIETLIEFGYTHTSHIGELSTYRREGSILTLTESQTGNMIQIEWFDTEIDSIIESDPRVGTRFFRESISIKNKNLQNSPITRQTGVLNPHMLGLLEKHHIIILGCDFLDYIETLREHAEYHYTDFYRDGSISLMAESPHIEHIDDLLTYLRDPLGSGKYRETSTKIEIYTRFERTVSEFIEFHQITGVQIIPVSRLGLESTVIHGSTMSVIGVLGKQEVPHIIIADDIIGKVFVRTRVKKSITKHLDLLLGLAPGDLVVHREHGIARFFALVHKEVGDMKREYIELHYAGDDKLYVPLTEVYRVSKYLGNPDVELTRLTGREWERTIEKTNEEIEAIAQDILETNAKRSLAKGRSFAKFRDREKEFRDAFSYEYTVDQKLAIEDIFGDMESEAPMDRLLSGDVGFGKTEVAMNAVYKAVLSGTQVAVISPLLVLADEHYETFCERMNGFGVRVAIMTRMNTARENTETMRALAGGEIDVIIGTHRLLSDDVRFHRLGLLVIDEEHKFGVSHKEKIKKIRAGVDILALSATPIPRSLNLALSGLKKVSLLTTPPKLKKPIETIITKWNESIIASAIHTELSRGGQVIILHNRIRGMESLAKEIGEIMGSDPKIQTSQHSNIQIPKIIITHGQMPGEDIEDRIHDFKRGEYDILLTTTIIENGVNFLRANTIIIIDPEEFGLASLHQLRGRVGRRDTLGYCYLMYRKPELSPDEKERLITIANNNHLGAGFEIAMRDMEIRGAGDVLGIKQSGRSKDVGLTLYFRLLEERIEEIRTQRKKRTLTKIELDITVSLPEEAFLSESDKLGFYREIESLETIEELEEMEADILHTLADPARTHEISGLFTILRARLILSEYGVMRVSRVGINYVFDFDESARGEEIRGFLERFDSQKRMVLLSMKKIRVETSYWKSSEGFLRSLV